MIALYLGLLGLFAFVLGFVVLGILLRKHPAKENAEKFSRIIHFLFFAGLGAPFVVAFFYPGLTHLDGLVGLSSLPLKLFFLIVGIVLAIPGLYFMGVSFLSLRSQGSGANAFKLTKRVVEKSVYQHTRNPMSFGYYLCWLAIGFISGSSLLTLFALIGIIPVHVFCLKFFEEYELELRFGESYKQYKKRVAFLIPKFTAEKSPETE